MIRTLAMRLVLQSLIGAADLAVGHQCKQGKRQGKASSDPLHIMYIRSA